jgi:hypothetical protein
MYAVVAKTGRRRPFHPSASSPQPPDSNRDTLRLETDVTPTNQKPKPGVNRDTGGVFASPTGMRGKSFDCRAFALAIAGGGA